MRKALFCLFLIPTLLKAQESVSDSSIFVPWIGVTMGFQFPGHDLQQRFGQNANIGVNFNLKTKKNWVFGVEGSFLFGNKVKEDGILDSIKTPDGFIIDQSGYLSQVFFFQRGFTGGGHVGHLFPVLAPNPNSGFLVTLGGGYLQHKIRIEDPDNDVSQLQGEMKKGYDRLTAGYYVSGFAGYVFLGNKRMVNFFAGVDYLYGQTQSRRSFDYDLRRADTQKRTDSLLGFRFGWILPLYERSNKFYYY